MNDTEAPGGIGIREYSVSRGLSIACTVVGAKKASKNHPFGYGRMEYVSSMIIMYIGVRSIIVLNFLMEHMPNPEGLPAEALRSRSDAWISLLKHWKD